MSHSEFEQKLFDYALGLLSQRSYTCAKMREKLEIRAKKLKLPSKSTDDSLPPLSGIETRKDFIDSIIDRLIELKLLDDLKYCRNWVAERNRMRPRGQYMLTQELRLKGVPKDILEQFWEEREPLDEIGLARELADKKKPRLRGNERQVREKLYRYLAGKGFRHEVIRELIN